MKGGGAARCKRSRLSEVLLTIRATALGAVVLVVVVCDRDGGRARA
jgi:hypothetical protein